MRLIKYLISDYKFNLVARFFTTKITIQKERMMARRRAMPGEDDYTEK